MNVHWQRIINVIRNVITLMAGKFWFYFPQINDIQNNYVCTWEKSPPLTFPLSYVCKCFPGYVQQSDDTCKESADLACKSKGCEKLGDQTFCRAAINDSSVAECYCPSGMELDKSDNTTCQVRGHKLQKKNNKGERFFFLHKRGKKKWSRIGFVTSGCNHDKFFG